MTLTAPVVTLESVMQQFRQLPPAEQLMFLDQADEALGLEDDGEGPGPDGADLPQELTDLLDARMAAIDADPSRGIPLEQFQRNMAALRR